MDQIKEKINAIVDRCKEDPKFRENFKERPVETVENAIGVDLPEEQIAKIVEGVKAKINVDGIGESLSGIGGLFNK